MSRIDEYQHALAEQADWEAYLLAESRLPGPRGNLELAQAAARSGSEAQFKCWREYTPDRAPTNTPGEFVAFCGVLGLGELLASGRRDVLPELRVWASDPRWRVREAAAMALQRWGDANPGALLEEMLSWASGNFREQRAAAAGLCEPRLLKDPAFTRQVLGILDAVTQALVHSKERRSPDFLTLRQALGYCWSVAAVALPEEGILLLRKWLASPDPDAAWIMRENLKKNRLKLYLDELLG